MTEAPAISISGLNFSYCKNERVLSDINLCMPQGDFMAVLGPNGGGKTTLLKLLLGLLEPDCGEIRIFGQPPREARAQIGYVPQFSTLNNSFPVSVLDAVLMGAAQKSSLRGVKWPTDRKAREMAEELLTLLGLAGLEARNISELSGGQKQRLMAARALMGKGPLRGRPFLLILDEPTSNIDPEGKCCFYDFLRTAGEDVSIVVVSHDLALAAANGAHSSSEPCRPAAPGNLPCTGAGACSNASLSASPAKLPGFSSGRNFNSIAVVNRTLTYSSEMALSREILRAFFGQHEENCLINDIINNMAACGSGS